MKPIFDGEYPAFSPFDRVALARLIRRAVHPNARMAEIGSWLGNGSTQVFLSELAAVPGALLYCIDHWRGSVNVARYQDLVAHRNVFATFACNVAARQIALAAWAEDSQTAAKRIGWAALDLVFIDAEHSYTATTADIAAWRTKVRPGGIICGHDCETRVTMANREALLAAGDADACYLPDVPFDVVHPGAVRAVHEAFAGDATLFGEEPITLPSGVAGYSSIWWCVVR